MRIKYFPTKNEKNIYIKAKKNALRKYYLTT